MSTSLWYIRQPINKSKWRHLTSQKKKSVDETFQNTTAVNNTEMEAPNEVKKRSLDK